MEFDKYQAASAAFDYPCPTQGRSWYYALGLTGEAGEVAEKVKKVYRDDVQFNQTIVVAIKKELGDVLWFVAALARHLGVSLDDVAVENLRKLKDREARMALPGSGDAR